MLEKCSILLSIILKSYLLMLIWFDLNTVNTKQYLSCGLTGTKRFLKHCRMCSWGTLLVYQGPSKPYIYLQILWMTHWLLCWLKNTLHWLMITWWHINTLSSMFVVCWSQWNWSALTKETPNEHLKKCISFVFRRDA